MGNWKILTLLMAMMVLVLAACGNKEEKAEEDTSKEADKPAEETTKEEDAGVYPLTIAQQDGFNEVTLDKMPEKVAVFDYGFLDTLDTLGVEVAAVAKQSLPGYLDKFADDKYEDLGGLKEPNFEAIATMKPDVIFISGRQGDAYEELSKIAPTVYIGLDNADYVNSFKANSELAGKIFGKEDVVTEKLAEFDAAVATLQEKAKATDKKALVTLGSAGELFAYGPGGRFGVVHDVYGVPAVDENIKVEGHGDSVSFEYILDKNPDILFVIDRDAAVGEESKTAEAIENKIVSKTTAAQNEDIYYLDPTIWYLSGGGLVSELEKVKSIDAAF